MNAFTALLRKDLVLHFSNRRAVLMSIAAPILIAAFFGAMFGNENKGPTHIPVAVTDLDQSALSRRIVANLQGETALALTEMSEAQALAQVGAGKLRAAITLPPGFGKQAAAALFGGRGKPEVALHYNPSQAMVLPMVRGLLAQHVMQPVSQAAFSSQGPVVQDLRAQVQASGGLANERRSALLAMFDSIARVQQPPANAASASASASASANVNANANAAPGLGIPFTTREVAAGSQMGTQYNSYAHSFAGMGVQFILLMGVDMGVGLLLMRRMGLWQRLRAAPLSRSQLLGSRIASCALIALIVFGVVYAVAMVGFGVRVAGSVAGFIAVLVAFSLFASSFGLMIAAVGRTPETTRGLAILATLLLVMLGGAWVPSFVFPPWLQTVSAWTPTHWAVTGLDAMTWRALPLQAALLPVAALLGFTALFAAVALARFRWQE